MVRNLIISLSEFTNLEIRLGASKFKLTLDPSILFPNESSSQSLCEKEYKRNPIPIYPPTIETKQILILRYLASMGHLQEVSI